MKLFAYIFICFLALAPAALATTPAAAPLSALTAPAPGMVYVATLRNGFSMRFNHRQILAETSRLFTTAGEDNYIDVPTEEISALTQEQLPPTPPAASAGTSVDMKAVVSSASDKHLIDADLIASVIRAESGFNPRAVSPKGARGLMQLMPGTAATLGVQDSFDAQSNVEGGTRYLRELLERYNGDVAKALAAYNAGPHRVEQYRGVPPYRETRAYVAAIIRDFNRKKLAARKACAAHPAPSSSKGALACAPAAKKSPPKSSRAAARPPASPVPGS